jgi:predicted outer membrane repeat protein
MKHQRYQLTSRPGSTAPHGTSRSLLLSTVFLLLVFKTTPGYGNEWNCVSTSGTYVKSADCAPMAGEVIVDGDLSITGNENTYTTLVAANNNRHFKIDSGTPTLALRWLNMTGGSPTDEHGGSICISDDIGGHLNITHCVFHKNSVGSGYRSGAIYAKDVNVLISLTNTKFIENSAGLFGGAIYFAYGAFHSHNVQYIQNSAKEGGGLQLSWLKPSTIHNNLFFLNEAEVRGGGARIYGDSVGSNTVNMTQTIFKRNKQTTGSDEEHGGGGLFIHYNVIISIRECTFLQNEADNSDSGHQIMTSEASVHGTPAITIVNTNFTNIDGTANNFYGYDHDASAPKHGTDKCITPSNCGTNPCIISPFAGTCTARTNTNYGVLCGLSVSVCPNGEFGNLPEVNESLLPPLVPPSCSAWTSCTAGNYVSTNGTATTDRVCTACGSQKYSTSTNQNSCMDWSNCSAGSYVSTPGSPSNNRVCTPCQSGKFTNASNLNECLNWTECESSQIIIVNGSNTGDRICGVETTTTETPTTSTEAPSTTTTTTGNTTTTETPTTTTSSDANATATKGNQLSGAIRSKRYWLSPTFVTVAWYFLV